MEGFAERPESHIDLPRRCDITGIERGQHVSQLTGGKMSPDADKSDGTHRQPRQVQRIVARGGRNKKVALSKRSVPLFSTPYELFGQKHRGWE